MKIRKMLATLLVLALVCALLPAAALAEVPTTVYVGDTDVSGGGTFYDGKVFYDAVNGMLTLNGVTVPAGSCHSFTAFSRPTNRSAALYADGDLTIVLTGPNEITGPDVEAGYSYGAYVNGRLTVSNTSTGTLTATAGSAGDDSYGVDAQGGITVRGGALTGKGGSADYSSYGVRAGDNGIEVFGGSLTGIGGISSSSSYGVMAANTTGAITVRGGTLTGRAGSSAYSNYGVKAEGALQVLGGTLTGTGNLVTGDFSSYGVHGFNGITVSAGALTGTGGNVSGGNSYGAFAAGDAAITLSGGTTIAKSGTATGISQAFNKQPGFGTEAWYQWRTSASGDCTSSSNSDPIVKYDRTATDRYVEISPAGAPYFTTQPTSQSVTEGQTATFSVAASGNPEPSYLWQCNDGHGGGWTDIAIATSLSYTTDAMPLAASGHQYRCIVSNSAGTVASDPAMVTVNARPAPSGGDSYTPPTVTVYNDPSASNATIWLTGSGLPANDLLITERLSSGSDYNAMLSLADKDDVFRVYNISLQSGKSATGSAMYLHFDLAARYAGKAFTLVHKLADGTYEYFYATADANGDLVFGPMDSLSPFMLVKGTLAQSAAAGNVVVPKTGDNALPGLWIGVCIIAGAGLAAVILAKRKQQA